MVDVLEEQVERGDALGQPLFDRAPFGRGEDARHQVVGEDPLGALLLAVDREGDALVQERQLGRLLEIAQLVGGQLKHALVERAVGRPRRARGIEHLVVGGVAADTR